MCFFVLSSFLGSKSSLSFCPVLPNKILSVRLFHMRLHGRIRLLEEVRLPSMCLQNVSMSYSGKVEPKPAHHWQSTPKHQQNKTMLTQTSDTWVTLFYIILQGAPCATPQGPQPPTVSSSNASFARSRQERSCREVMEMEQQRNRHCRFDFQIHQAYQASTCLLMFIST